MSTTEAKSPMMDNKEMELNRAAVRRYNRFKNSQHIKYIESKPLEQLIKASRLRGTW